MSLNSQIPDRAIAITPSDATRFALAGILVGGAGTVVVEPERGGNTVTINAVAGQTIPLRVVRVLAASTATGLVGIY